MSAAATAQAAEPRVLVDGCQLELIAKEPDIVTPIGTAVDAKGRLLVVESHTHERPPDYKGPSGDRIRMLADSDGDGKLDKWSTFAEGYQQAMNLCVRPDGAVYLVTRRDVRLLRDTNGDGVADQEQMLIKLQTEDQYPHNALSGIALAKTAEGDAMYLGLGENHGAPYKLIGSDGVVIEDHGGAGTIFRCGLNGEKLERYATGFWNPFSICCDDGHVFCVDNDPDSSPPCRLIEALPAGDYGHRYEYGRAGVHPLQSWNGELPGTLPMICGTGEAPTVVILHHGYLWVTSWGDHRIDRFELSLDGNNMYQARRTTVVQGDANFRPTGMTVTAGGSLYFADWVDRSYPVHGKGRIWRLQVGNESTKIPVRPSSAQFASSAPTRISPIALYDEAVRWPSLRQAFISSQKSQPNGDDTSRWNASPNPQVRLMLLERLRWHGLKGEVRDRTLRAALADRDADLRLYAIRWIGDERISALRDDVAKLLNGPMPNERYFLGVLAAIDWLEGDSSMRNSGISDELLIRELQNSKRSSEQHALALRLINPNHKWLTLARLKDYLKSDAEPVRTEAVRTLAIRGGAGSWTALAEVAKSSKERPQLRADAIAGLAGASENFVPLLEQLAGDGDVKVAAEATRVLRLTGKHPAEAEQKPAVNDLDAWNQLIGSEGEAESGRRLFFTAAGPRCANCHQFAGRGGRIGPDLTHLGRQQSRERIVASVLQPSRDMAPDYQPWTLLTSDGVAHVGLRLPKGGDDGKEEYADANGHEFELNSEDIDVREPSEKSIMPDGLERTLSINDLRDLVAFLAAGS
jgi:putative membrane-bound dehydrogenase-like protein